MQGENTLYSINKDIFHLNITTDDDPDLNQNKIITPVSLSQSSIGSIARFKERMLNLNESY